MEKKLVVSDVIAGHVVPNKLVFTIEMGVAGSIFEPHPKNFGKSDIFWRSTNDIIIMFGNFHYYESLKKYS